MSVTETVICFDFDGTLVDSQGRIHPADVAILGRASPFVFLPATGRLIPSVRRTFAQHGLFAGRPIPLPMVLQNGAALYAPGEVLCAGETFARAVQNDVIDRMEGHPEIASFFFGLEEVFLLWPSPVAEAAARRFALDVQPFVPACRQQAFTKLMAISAEPEPLQRFAAELAGLPLAPAFSLPTVLEINQPGIDKGRGLVTLLGQIGLAGARLVAAGDGENDLPLFAVAERVFVPAGSPAFIRAHADHLIDVRQTGLLAPILAALAGE